MHQLGNAAIMDPTNPDARKYVWSKIKKNYYDDGVRIFWLDEAEPEFSVYDYDNYRYFMGRQLKSEIFTPSFMPEPFTRDRGRPGWKLP